MALISLRQLLDHAAEHGYGLPAFNVNSMEQILSVMEAARKVDAPVILQASRSARSYATDAMLRHMVQAAVELYPGIPIVLHHDHGNGVESCRSAMENGFTSVMMDGSLEEDGKTPASYAYNVQVTARVADLAHTAGASVEGELGCLGSLETGLGEAEDGHGAEGKLSHEQLLTDPEQARDFVLATKVDALAVAIGASHGAYKFNRPPTAEVLAIHVVKAIHALLPQTHLVMHGSSTVPQELRDIINTFGGDMPPTWGVPIAEIQEGIKHGVRKVNIDTDGRMAITGQFRKVAMEKPGEFDPRAFMKPARAALEALCAQRYEEFGAAGMASRIRPIPLSDMAARYASGALDPQRTVVAG